jgi:hypothetical protein
MLFLVVRRTYGTLNNGPGDRVYYRLANHDGIFRNVENGEVLSDGYRAVILAAHLLVRWPHRVMINSEAPHYRHARHSDFEDFSNHDGTGMRLVYN